LGIERGVTLIIRLLLVESVTAFQVIDVDDQIVQLETNGPRPRSGLGILFHWIWQMWQRWSGEAG
jgi:hypothetical protein